MSQMSAVHPETATAAVKSQLQGLPGDLAITSSPAKDG